MNYKIVILLVLLTFSCTNQNLGKKKITDKDFIDFEDVLAFARVYKVYIALNIPDLHRYPLS